MPDSPIIKTDQGAINARILAREAKADFRRIEAASLKVITHLTSAEAKRMFVRMFSTLQLNSHFISVIARTRLEHADIEKIEAAMRKDMETVTESLNQAIDGAETLFKTHGISNIATYDAKPLEIEVGLLSSSGRRFLEMINKMDQLMPLLQTLEIHEILTTHAVDVQRAALKRQIRGIANSARRLATGLRRRMNALAAAEASLSSSHQKEDGDTEAKSTTVNGPLSGGEQAADLSEHIHPSDGTMLGVQSAAQEGNPINLDETDDAPAAPGARRTRRQPGQPKELADGAEAVLPEPIAEVGLAMQGEVKEGQQ